MISFSYLPSERITAIMVPRMNATDLDGGRRAKRAKPTLARMLAQSVKVNLTLPPDPAPARSCSTSRLGGTIRYPATASKVQFSAIGS
jgi:hypothetical protein